MTKLALLGPGNMGLAAGDRLLDACHELAVWNRSAIDLVKLAKEAVAT